MTDINWYSDKTATFGDRIAAAREAQSMDQKTLARKIGVMAKTVENWENDMAEPRANKLQMLSGVLNVSIPWLLTGEGEGVDVPVDVTPADITEVLAEMRALKSQMSQAADRVGVLEKRLKTLVAGALA